MSEPVYWCPECDHVWRNGRDHGWFRRGTECPGTPIDLLERIKELRSHLDFAEEKLLEIELVIAGPAAIPHGNAGPDS